MSVDGVADAPLERPDRFFAGVAFGELAVVEGSTFGGVEAGLGDGSHVGDGIETAVAAPREPEDLAPPAPPLPEEEAQARLTALAARIEDGWAASGERADLMARLAREGWVQDAIAKAAGISQAAVSKALRSTPGSRALEECRTAPYLAGRLVGLACHLAGRHPGMASERQAGKIAEGGLPVTPVVLHRLQGLLSRDLARPGIPGVYRTQCAEITARLADLPGIPRWPWPLQDQWEFTLAQHHQSQAIRLALRHQARQRAN